MPFLTLSVAEPHFADLAWSRQVNDFVGRAAGFDAVFG